MKSSKVQYFFVDMNSSAEKNSPQHIRQKSIAETTKNYEKLRRSHEDFSKEQKEQIETALCSTGCKNVRPKVKMKKCHSKL